MYVSISQSMTRSLNRSLMRALLSLCAVSLIAPSLIGCGPTQASLAAREASIKRVRGELRGLRNAHKTALKYHAHLKSGDGKVLLIGRRDIERAFASMLPYTYRGRELSKKYLKGEISFTKMTDFKFLPGNRAEFSLHFDGRKIKTKKVPAIARGQVQSLKRAVRAGSVLVEVSFFIHGSQRQIVLEPHAVAARFKQENTSGNQRNFLDAVNKKVFNRHKRIPLPAGVKGSVRALSTPHHFVIMSNE